MSVLSRRAALRGALLLPGDGASAAPWSFDARVVAASGLSIPVPPGYAVGFWDDFTDYTSYAELEAATYAGDPVYSAYSGQDAAYASGYWAKSHVTFSGGQLVLNGYFDPAVHASKYVTGGFATYWLARNGHVPAGSMWVWCAREETVAGQPIKAVAMTYGTTWPAAGTFVKRGPSCSNVGNGLAEWPYCGENDLREGTQGASTSSTTLHWHDPALVTCSVVGGSPTGNLNGHHQQQIGTLGLDHSRWHIYGTRIDSSGGTDTYHGWTNDNAGTDVPLREFLTVPGVDDAFGQGGPRLIYQQEANGQPTGGTPATRVYVDWIANLIALG